MPDHYHYIITGAGCAGSSLLMRMMQNPFFADKKILVIDKSPKTENDRTWCFWEKDAGIFESLIHHSWQQAEFFSNFFSATLTLSPYRYKMIRGIDLYSFVQNESARHNNIEWRYERVLSITSTNSIATVMLETGSLTADYVFNSILFEPFSIPAGKHFLWQHFYGWMIQTTTPCFNPQTATLMDFRVSQEQGTTFMYVMPTSATTALVEYTLFTEKLLEKEAYEKALEKYIAATLGISAYAVSHKEVGKIPMTNTHFPKQDGRIVYIGIAGGQAKGSSGYAFQFIQKRTKQIIQSLIEQQPLLSTYSFTDKKFALYDSVLLHILHYHKMEGAEIFARIFKGNPAERVLRFLDNETHVWDDLQIMRSMPTAIFLPAALQELKKLV